MKPIYEQCQTDSGKGVIKRSMDRIEEFLSDHGTTSPFVTIANKVTNKFLATDEKHIKKHVQPAVEDLLLRLYKSVEELLDNQVVDEAELVAKAVLQDHMPTLLSDWKQVSKDLKAIKAKYDDQKKLSTRI